MKDYLKLLNKAGLLNHEKSVYTATESGLRCLKHYSNFKSLIFLEKGG